VSDPPADEVLTTARAVRRHLDLARPVDPALVDECLAIALQAPNGGNDQGWHFVVVTDARRRAAIAEVYRAASVDYAQRPRPPRPKATIPDDERVARRRVMASAAWLFEHLHEVPVLVVAAVDGRYERSDAVDRATAYGSVFPAVWSLILAARARGLGASLTTVHLQREAEMAAVLGIPYESVTQVALVPLAHVTGSPFRPGRRRPLAEVVHRDGW
jgi:nitroreductase